MTGRYIPLQIARLDAALLAIVAIAAAAAAFTLLYLATRQSLWLVAAGLAPIAAGTVLALGGSASRSAGDLPSARRAREEGRTLARRVGAIDGTNRQPHQATDKTSEE